MSAANAQQRLIRVHVDTLRFDMVLAPYTDTGVAKIKGLAAMEDAAGSHDLGHVEVTLWGATLEQLRSRALQWPTRFDDIDDAHFGVSSRDEHRFDIFIAHERFMHVMTLLRDAGRSGGSGGEPGQIVLHVDVAPDASYDLVTSLEISGGWG
ncbi:MAG: hypothetical protein JJU21_01645 [Salinarimonas sp.]|nr:hypothetical protein [Salinarimonas sp.]